MSETLEQQKDELEKRFHDWQHDLHRMKQQHCHTYASFAAKLREQSKLAPLQMQINLRNVGRPRRASIGSCTTMSWASEAVGSWNTERIATSPKPPVDTPRKLPTWGAPKIYPEPVEDEDWAPPGALWAARKPLTTPVTAENRRSLRFSEDRTSMSTKEVPRKISKQRSSRIVVESSFSGLKTTRLKDCMFCGCSLQKFVRSVTFRAICSMMILANAVYIGLYAEEQLDHILEGRTMPNAWEYVEFSFCAFFGAELFLRLLGEKSQFFTSKDEACWNLFDSVLVLLSVVDIILSEKKNVNSLNLTFARTLRVFRFARILRIVRVMRFFYSFRLMVYSVMYSIASLLWVFILLLFIMYFFAVVFLNGVVEYFRENPDHNSDLSRDLITLFGTVENAVQCLFMSITGGIDWNDALRPLTRVNWAYGKIFVFYIYFMVFGVLNVVIAAFVDSASQISSRDRELVTQNEMAKSAQYAQNLRRFFHEADSNGNGVLTWEEFEAHLNCQHVQAYFQSLDLDVSQAGKLFKLLDQDDSNDVGIDEFVEGCMRMKGQSRSIDVHMLLYVMERMVHRQENFMEFCEEQFLVLVGGGSPVPGSCVTSPTSALYKRRKLLSEGMPSPSAMPSPSPTSPLPPAGRFRRLSSVSSSEASTGGKNSHGDLWHIESNKNQDLGGKCPEESTKANPQQADNHRRRPHLVRSFSDNTLVGPEP